MTKIRIGNTLTYNVTQPTIFLLKTFASTTEHQLVCSENHTINCDLQLKALQTDSEGNRIHRLVVNDTCEFTVKYQALIEMTPEIERPKTINEAEMALIPTDVLPYMNPSRYCESELLARFAYEEFGQLKPGYPRVQTICDWVYGHLDYTPGSTTVSTTAADVLLQRTGVCRDYAHLAISLCRGLGIPARYISGYAVDLQPPDFHGFMEAYLDGYWFLFDPSRLAPTYGLVRIGVGRDAADVAFTTYTGAASLIEKTVWAEFEDSKPENIRDLALSAD